METSSFRFKYINNLDTKIDYIFNEIYIWAENNLKDECIECLVSLMMEPYDEIVNPMISKMSSDEDKYFDIPTDRTIEDLRNILEINYSNICKFIL